MEMTRHIRPFYVRAHINGKLVSKVLMDTRLAVNVILLRMLRALGRGIGDLIETEVSISYFTGEILRLWAFSLLTSLWVVRLLYQLSL